MNILKRYSGFSLTELLIAVAISSVIYLLAAKYIKDIWLIATRSLSGSVHLFSEVLAARTGYHLYLKTSVIEKRDNDYSGYDHCGNNLWKSGDDSGWKVEINNNGTLKVMHESTGIIFPEFKGIWYDRSQP